MTSQWQVQLVNVATGWARLRKGLELEDPTPTGLYLGCIHEVDTSVPKVTAITYNMELLFKDCVAAYVSLTGHSKGFKHVMTPFLPEDQSESTVGRPQSSKGAGVLSSIAPGVVFFRPGGAPSHSAPRHRPLWSLFSRCGFGLWAWPPFRVSAVCPDLVPSFRPSGRGPSFY